MLTRHADTGIHHGRLANGLEVLVRPRRSVPIVCFMTWYRVGSVNEASRETGLAHFIEHLMFKGTARLAKGQIDAITQRTGGRNNAFTSHDFTAYYFQFASDRWQTALEIEADRMVGCAFAPDELERERKVVLEEIRRDMDSPWGALDQAVVAATFVHHPYRHPVLGWFEDIEAVSRAEVVSFYRRHYMPSNAFSLVTGDVDPDEAAAAVDRAFGRLEPGHPGRVEPRPEPDPCGEKRVVVRKDVEVQRLAISYRSVPITAPEFLALEMLEVHLGEGKASLLHHRLVEEAGLFRRIFVSSSARRHGGVFWIYGTLQPGVEPARGLEALDLVLDEARRRQIDAAQLQRARNLVETRFLSDRERVSEDAFAIGRTHALCGFELLGDYLDRVRSVDRAAIAEAARRFLDPDRRVVGTLLARRNGE